MLLMPLTLKFPPRNIYLLFSFDFPFVIKDSTFKIIQKWPLKELSLRRVTNDEIKYFANLEYLDTLNIYSLRLSKDAFNLFFSNKNIQKIKNLTIYFEEDINDEDFLLICQCMRRLEYLKIMIFLENNKQGV